MCRDTPVCLGRICSVRRRFTGITLATQAKVAGIFRGGKRKLPTNHLCRVTAPAMYSTKFGNSLAHCKTNLKNFQFRLESCLTPILRFKCTDNKFPGSPRFSHTIFTIHYKLNKLSTIALWFGIRYLISLKHLHHALGSSFTHYQ